MLGATDLVLSYGETIALANANIAVRAGESVALVGPSGSGKSSLLYCLAGLLAPDHGEVLFNGVDLTQLTDGERSDVRRTQFGFVFQFSDLVPELTLRENISIVLEINGVGRSERRTRVDELVNALGIDGCADRRPAKVSGGQAQRAAVARAMAHRPKVVFADEPTGALDSANSVIVLDALLDLARRDGTTVVIVTHDPNVASKADRIIAMSDGVVVEGAPSNA